MREFFHRAFMPAMAISTLVVLTACQSAEPAQVPPATPKQTCSAPPPVRDIWALEPMLTEKGLIKPDMSRDQKEQIIRDYIRDRNQRYKDCNKRK